MYGRWIISPAYINMKSVIPYIVGTAIVLLGTMPSLHYQVAPPLDYWPWMVLIAGFFGFYLCFLKTSVFVKMAAIGLFINSFVSTAPFVSLTQYICIVGCLYFYVLCTKIEDFSVVFRLLQCLLILHSFMFFMQFIGKDKLLNFYDHVQFGIVGQHMQSASFSVILSAALLPFNRLNILFPSFTSFLCQSAGAFFCTTIGLIFIFLTKGHIVKALIVMAAIAVMTLLFSHKFVENAGGKSNGRLVVWKRSIQLTALNHPIVGYGIGTYKFLFPVLSDMKTLPWKTAHNCFVQIFFETGFVGLYVAIAYVAYLFMSLWKLLRRKIFKDQALYCLAGLAMIAANMLIHFPTRQLNCVLIIIFFLAYVQRTVSYGQNET